IGLRDLVGVHREGDRPTDPILDGGPGQILGPTGRHLDDPVGLGLRESTDRRVERLGGCAVDGRVREAFLLCSVDELRIALRGGDGHDDSFCETSWPHAFIPAWNPPLRIHACVMRAYADAMSKTVDYRAIGSWTLWDWGSASFNAVIVTFVFAPYLPS